MRRRGALPSHEKGSSFSVAARRRLTRRRTTYRTVGSILHPLAPSPPAALLDVPASLLQQQHTHRLIEPNGELADETAQLVDSMNPLTRDARDAKKITTTMTLYCATGQTSCRWRTSGSGSAITSGAALLRAVLANPDAARSAECLAAPTAAPAFPQYRLRTRP